MYKCAFVCGGRCQHVLCETGESAGTIAMSLFADTPHSLEEEEQQEQEDKLFSHEGFDAKDNYALSNVVLLDEEGFQS